MSKPNIVPVTTNSTFQVWLDKTNEMVGLFKTSALTASTLGDTTEGNAKLLGEFSATTVVAEDELLVDNIVANTTGLPVTFSTPVNVVSAQNQIAATFTYGAQGARTRYTTGDVSWDIGFENKSAANFIITTGAGGQFSLSTGGVLTVPSIVTEADMEITDDLRIGGDISANNAVFQDITSAGAVTSPSFIGDLTGDVYSPAGGKILENGNPAGGIPATFTGNVNGTVSSLTNHTTDSLKEGTTRKYFTNARVNTALAAGVGVSISKNDQDVSTINIGQNVGTAANVSFGNGQGDAITADGNIVLTGTLESAAVRTDDVKVDGAIVATGNITAFGSISDITMKGNITPIENALEKVSQLGGYLFNYKGDDTQMTGVMAQELKDVLPGVVYETIDPRTNEKVFAVRHGNIIGLLIEAIKELQEKVSK